MKADIESLFRDLNQELSRLDVQGQLYLVGGAAMCLAYNARASTRDVDALFKPSKIIKEAAARVAISRGLDNPNWLNDGVKGFLSERAAYNDYLELSHLKISVAQPEYMLAMKCLAMRIGEEFQDLKDVRFLLTLLGVNSYEQAKEIIFGFYPESKFPQKTLYALEEILAED